MSSLGSELSVKLNEGDLFISICATVGKPCISNIKCCIHDGFVYFPNLDKRYNKYLYYIFISGTCYAGLGKLGTQLNLNTTWIGNITIPIPPLNEIADIVKYIERKTCNIDATILDTRESISCLKDYRQSLITESVTGKIDVTGEEVS